MGRLTRRAEADGVKAVWYGKRDVFLEGEVGYTEADKLAHYEDLEEQGRLIELRLAVGDTVWEIDEYAEGFKARPMAVLSIELKENKGYVYTTYSDEHDDFARGYGFDDFGNILFLTKEEAEAKLKELEG